MNNNPELSLILGDLAECNNEAIHLSGAVQSHGCAIFFTWPDRRIVAHSANCASKLKIPTNQLEQGHLGFLFDTSILIKIENLIRKGNLGAGRYFTCELDGIKTDAYLYETYGVYCVELEPGQVTSVDEEPFQAEFILQQFMSELKDTREIKEAANITCKYVRKATNIDRAMMYKFIPPAWHGEVVGEDRVLGAHSFMNHRFPSSDIPKPARDLYLRNKVRLISDSQADISPIIPNLNPMTRTKWNLSDSRLRSVAPIHLEYLRNMGVRGSMSFAVIVKGELWGLIACHHMSPFNLSHEIRAICAVMADAFAAHASLIELFEGQTVKSVFDAKLRKIVESVISVKDPVDALFRQHSYLMDMFSATGLALCGNKRVDIAGITPPSAMLKNLASGLRELLEKSEKPYIATANLAEMLPAFDKIREIACGILCVPLNDEDNSLLILFRPELIKVITWGGDPNKNLEKKNFSGRINPRNSFSSWEEVIRNSSKGWAPYKIDGLMFLKQVVVDTVAQKNFLISQLTAK
ncbi:GAF domain-containing protein [Bdellovibrio sp. SKB1291214]|uniref:GAF domain-containing protein n=1 Tax=Bdellovibrio sp. SKB1291214 TaxID=1732569 RepID=UPI00223F0543|nr:GAF domain-containing protein [Bdellovibrio sp. SKB1291214]UYL09416.1 GAF domain-containing protein [Bdellovibrio sp. SKB1291214]